MDLTPAIQYIQSKGWEHKASGGDQIELETCPYCKKNNYGHFYMKVEKGNRDGLWSCHRCGKSGNLTTLQEDQGDRIRGVESRGDWAKSSSPIEPMPNIQELHEALLADEDAMLYLTDERGFSRDIIERLKLGLAEKRYFRECGEVPALVYPYLVQGNPIFVHYRTLPPAPKAFSSLKGWDAPLYNGEIIREGLKELTLVEGEANTIAALDHGITDIVGVPGANFKKAMWLETLDALELDDIFICYDKDKTGQKAAQTLASRVGVNRCKKIILPDFGVPTKDGTKPGKDLNEWFVYGGGTLEQWEELKRNATLFDVQGVASTKDALEEFEEKLEGKAGLSPTYNTPWKPVNELVGFEDGDVIDIVAPEKIGKTTIGLNLLEYEVDATGEDGIIICGEMPRDRMARKWVSHVAQVPDNIPKTPEESAALLDAFKNGIKTAKELAANRKGNLYFCYPQINTIDDLYKLIIDCIRRYGVKWIMVDNLQLFCDNTLTNKGHRTIYLSQISKQLAKITKDYGVKMVRILQPHRIRDGEVISTNDVDGSSQIAKDCDCMITAWRNPLQDLKQKDFEGEAFIQEQIAFDPKLLLTIGLSRYSTGGRATLWMDGATSTVKEYDPAKRYEMSLSKTVSGYTIPVEEKITPTEAAVGITV